MRKLLFSLLAIAGLTLTSCTKDEAPMGSVRLDLVGIQVDTGAFVTGKSALSSRDPRPAGPGAQYNGSLSITITDVDDASNTRTFSVSLDGSESDIMTAFSNKTQTGLSFGEYTVTADISDVASSDSSRLNLDSITGSFILGADGATIAVELSPADAFIASDSSGVDPGSASFAATANGDTLTDSGYYVAPGIYTVVGAITLDGTELASSTEDVTLAAGQHSTVIFSYTPGDAGLTVTIGGWTGI